MDDFLMIVSFKTRSALRPASDDCRYAVFGLVFVAAREDHLHLGNCHMIVVTDACLPVVSSGESPLSAPVELPLKKFVLINLELPLKKVITH
ncbi:hypothetical protein V2J09_009756 [Rumex salicifolius]